MDATNNSRNNQLIDMRPILAQLNLAGLIPPTNTDMLTVACGIWYEATIGHAANTVKEAIRRDCISWTESRYYRPADLAASCERIENDRIRKANLGDLVPPPGVSPVEGNAWLHEVRVSVADGTSLANAILRACQTIPSQTPALASDHDAGTASAVELVTGRLTRRNRPTQRPNGLGWVPRNQRGNYQNAN